MIPRIPGLDVAVPATKEESKVGVDGSGVEDLSSLVAGHQVCDRN